MKGLWWILAPLALAAGLAFLAVGCSDSSTNNSSAISDQEALQQLMLNDSDIEDVSPFWGDDNLGGGGPLDDPINPVRWGRMGQRQPVSVNVDITGDSLATITRTVSFNGQFRVVDGVNDSTFIRYDKPMYNNIVRKAHAVRVGRSPDPRHNWHITEVTPAVMVSASPNPHTIEPVRVQVYKDSTGGMVLVSDISDPLNTYFNRDNLPDVQPNDTVTIYATANSTTPAAVFLHPHVYRHGRVPRLPLYDDGMGADHVAGDGIYSGRYVARDFDGIFLSGIDVLDHGTLYDSVLPYDCGAWAIPYRVSMH